MIQRLELSLAPFCIRDYLDFICPECDRFVSYLFGNVLAVRESDLLLTALVSGIVLIFVFFFYKELKITSFDPTMAKAYGLNTSLIHYLLMFF